MQGKKKNSQFHLSASISMCNSLHRQQRAVKSHTAPLIIIQKLKHVGVFFSLIPRHVLTAPVVHCAGVSQLAQAEVSDLEDEAAVHHTVGGGQAAVGM